MGLVLSFSPRASSGGSHSRPNGEQAAVIIFPGVRYERIEPDNAAAAVKSPVDTQKSH